ncbi:MFS transporter [Pseudonocardia humida]|uniref:MFS transporter n=1 Tax=Pseudonocardia humida TaxID=2800819 RepID=A0ABT0ZVR4_9PSEU|nr:MFS transporter [Pseudonocardia humida]MCO1654808.1 MFS transporter [Pseudonocardia humida]
MDVTTAPRTTERTRWAPIVALGLAMFVVTAEMTVTAVTLPGMAADLGISPATTAWVLLGYALPMAAVAIPAGRWADGASARAALVAAMVGVGVASVLTAVAPAFWVVVVGRLLQGLAASLVIAVYMPIVMVSVRPEQRGRAIGFIITIMTVGGVIGAPLGGFVAGALDWRGVFLMKLPLLVAVAWVALRTLPRDGRGLPRPGPGLLGEAALLGGAVCALMLAVDFVDDAPLVAGALVVVGAVTAWGWTRLPGSAPVVAMIRGRVFGPVLVALLAASFTIGLVAFLLPFYVSDVLRGSPEVTGTVLLFFAGAVAPVSPLAGALSDRFGTRVVAVIGSTVTLVGLALMLTVDADAGPVGLAWRLAVLGIGAGLFNPAINAATLAAAPTGMEGTAGGIAMTARTLATTVAPGVVALCWALAGGGLAGFRSGVLVLGAVMVVGLAALLVPTGRRVKA